MPDSTPEFVESRKYRDALRSLWDAHPDFEGLDPVEVAQAEAAAETEARVEAGRKRAHERAIRDAA